MSVKAYAICGDADDLYYSLDRWAIVCGSGAVELIKYGVQPVSVRTHRAARTALLDPISGHLLVAAPARRPPDAIWELSFR
jgi:hypothetical protein